MDELWVFLNQPTEPTWLHTLFGGLVSAIIGAIVAVGVVVATVRTQNAGIKEQLKAQDEGIQKQLDAQERGIEKQLKAQYASVQEQLKVQRRENARSREVEVAARLLSALRAFAVSVGADKNGIHDMIPNGSERILIMNSSFEELRLDLDAENDALIDAFKGLVAQLHIAMRDYTHRDEKYPSFRRPLDVMTRIESFLTQQVVQYMRSSPEHRLLMEPLLVGASDDLELSESEWESTYGIIN